MDEQKVKAKEGPKQATPGQLTQLTRAWAEFFGRLTASEDSHDKAQRLIGRFDMLDVVADGFFSEERPMLITFWHGRLRVDYSVSLATLMHRNGVRVRDGSDRLDITSFRARGDRKGVWECRLDVVAVMGLERRPYTARELSSVRGFILELADAHQAYEFASVCPTNALPRCRIAVGGMLMGPHNEFGLSLFNYNASEKYAERWNASRAWGSGSVEPTLQRRTFLLAVSDEKPVE